MYEADGDLPLSRAKKRDRAFQETGDRRAAAFLRESPERKTAASTRSDYLKLNRRERDLNKEVRYSSGRSPRRSTAWVRVVVFAAVFIVVGIGVGFGVASLTGNLPSQIKSGSANSESIYDPFIEEGVDKNGNAVHVLTFYGSPGDMIYIKELKKNFTIEVDNARVTIPDNTFIGEDPDSPTAEVTLHPVLYAEGKKPRELNPVVYSVEIPPSPITVLEPSEQRATTYTSIYLVKVEVLKESTVYINGNDVTDMVNSDNIIAYNVEIRPVGENFIDVRVSTPGYRTNTVQIVIDRPYMDIPLEVDINAPTSSTSSAVTITGKTTPGAQLKIEPGNETVEVKDDGKFSVRIKLDRYGENTFTLTASMAGKQDSTINHTIVYSPNLDEYSRNAWKMDYDHLIKNQSAFQGAKYKCTGTLVEELSANPYIFTFNVGTKNDPKLLVIEMIKDKPVKLNPDISYDIYADVEGTYEGYPRLNGRFCLETADK